MAAMRMNALLAAMQTPPPRFAFGLMDASPILQTHTCRMERPLSEAAAAKGGLMRSVSLSSPITSGPDLQLQLTWRPSCPSTDGSARSSQAFG